MPATDYTLTPVVHSYTPKVVGLDFKSIRGIDAMWRAADQASKGTRMDAGVRRSALHPPRCGRAPESQRGLVDRGHRVARVGDGLVAARDRVTSIGLRESF